MNNPFYTPIYLMAKPVGAMCNMACTYCYYLEKRGLYPESRRTLMSEATLEAYIKRYIEAQTGPAVQFTWHGGEATMRSLDFYRRAMDLQREYAGNMVVENCLQTNGTLLDEEWCRFLHDNRWLVGLSVDGPEEFHNEYRRNAGGKASFQSVMRAVRLLNRHGVDWNAMAVVNDFNADYPEDFYEFFREIGCNYLQFTPIVERNPDGSVTDFSVTPQQWGEFLCRVFDRWVTTDVGSRFVQLFDATLANWVGETPGVCTMARECGHAAAMEWNGDVYCCDHFVDKEHLLGNIHTDSLVGMMMSDKQIRFGRAKYDQLADACHECPYLFACHGECPKNRFAESPGDDPRRNYLCAGYRRFFEHCAPAMHYMKTQLAAELPPKSILTDKNIQSLYKTKH